jgi:dephospho-CoA kinase
MSGGKMSRWPGKYVIGLTGNIATGKSVVRRMLEHLGAYGIDADALAHRAISKEAPGYQPVVEAFGNWILTPDGQIDRSRLGQLVFSAPQALKRLEAIVHPLVGQALDVLIQRSRHEVIVIEAIKLLESDLAGSCDTIWTTYAPLEVQVARLVKKRKMSQAVAQQRVSSQPPQDEKIVAADVVVRNDGSFDSTWQQVSQAWGDIPAALDMGPVKVQESIAGEMAVERAGPDQAEEIASFITRMSGGERRLVRDDVMAAFGEKAFLLLKSGDRILGLVGWQVENLVARTDDVYVNQRVSFQDAMHRLLVEVERASRELQCEIALLFLPPDLAGQGDIWRSLGYEPRTIESLNVRAWQEAAEESMPDGSDMLFKQLREDRVLRPV